MNKPKLPTFDVESFANHRNSTGVYWLILGVLTVLILVTGASIALQSQERHRTYRTLQTLKKDYTTLKSEEQRLLIEQQTFSATSQVVRRSVDELGMFFPTKQHRQVITPTAEVLTDQGE
ncbi:MAG: cell division protein FtsL [Moraxella sp.]|nr:cell division protein FtsL [Moraxella sp.]